MRSMKPNLRLGEPIFTLVVEEGTWDVRFTTYYCNFRWQGLGIWTSLYWARKLARFKFVKDFPNKPIDPKKYERNKYHE
jgi:hypothetical protein